MHFGFLFIGLVSGFTAATAVISLGGSMLLAMLFYALFSLASVIFGAIIWGMSPHFIPAHLLAFNSSSRHSSSHQCAEHDP